jgi:hypothetical protein
MVERDILRLATSETGAARPWRRGDPDPEGVTFSTGPKYDFQLDKAKIDERRLAHIFTTFSIFKAELKSENKQWEEFGNICIEFRRDGLPSGIAKTEAEMWVHELQREGETLVYLMFPIERLKELARRAYAEGRWRAEAGDGGRQAVILIPLAWVINWPV